MNLSRTIIVGGEIFIYCTIHNRFEDDKLRKEEIEILMRVKKD